MISLYLVTNKINNKKYVGKTSREPIVRWREHIRNANYDRDYHLSNAIRKYGVANFSIRVIDRTEDIDVADYLETMLIAAYNTKDRKLGYNMTDGGDGLINPSEEVRIKRSLAMSGRKQTEEWKEAASLRMLGNQYAKGVSFSEDRKKQMSAIIQSSDAFRQSRDQLRGRKHSPDHNRKISEALLGNKNHFYGRKHTAESIEKMKLAKKKQVFADA